MMRFLVRTFAQLFGVPLIIVIAFILIVFHPYTWNQKLIISVETPEGVITASSVVAVKVVSHDPCPLKGIAACVSNGYRGEAVVLRLPHGNFLFVLLPHNPQQFAQDTFKGPIYGRERYDPEEMYRLFKPSLDPAPVPREKYPLFVFFEDIADASSVKEVNPDDLSASFGPGYALKSLTLEITRDRQTSRVKKVLPWLDEYVGIQFDFSDRPSLDAKNKIANALSSGHFKVGK
jgi:hypothetical protein